MHAARTGLATCEVGDVTQSGSHIEQRHCRTTACDSDEREEFTYHRARTTEQPVGNCHVGEAPHDEFGIHTRLIHYLDASSAPRRQG
jgi:hypothetical protein